jgi:hypothetical protein
MKIYVCVLALACLTGMGLTGCQPEEQALQQQLRKTQQAVEGAPAFEPIEALSLDNMPAPCLDCGINPIPNSPSPTQPLPSENPCAELSPCSQVFQGNISTYIFTIEWLLELLQDTYISYSERLNLQNNIEVYEQDIQREIKQAQKACQQCTRKKYVSCP